MRKPTNVQRAYFIDVANSKTNKIIKQNDIDKLRKVLNEITKQGKLPQSSELDYFINIAGSYIEHLGKKTFINGELHYYDELIEEPCFPTGLVTSDKEIFMLFELSKSLCLFLGKKDNLKKIKKCKNDRCNNFFIAKDVKRAICYKKRCHNFYQAGIMRKRRENTKNNRTIKTK